MYFGPRTLAQGYFEDLGFECPPRQTTADFLTAVADSHTRVVRKGYEHLIPRTPEDFEQRFQKSQIAQSNLTDIQSFENTLQQLHAADRDAHEKMLQRSVYTLSFAQQVWVCAVRQFQVLWGDKTVFIGKFVLTTFIALIFGSMFYNQPATSSGVFTRGGVILYAPPFVIFLLQYADSV